MIDAKSRSSEACNYRIVAALALITDIAVLSSENLVEWIVIVCCLSIDTEEAIWAFLCDARDPKIGFSRAQLTRVGPDPRRYMRAAYDLFNAGDAASDVALEDVASLGPVDEFYSLLYRGLWWEAAGDVAGARDLIVKATRTQYASRSGDYMAALALVHCKRRGWAT